MTRLSASPGAEDATVAPLNLLPRDLPRGADPLTYKLEQVERLMQSAYFSLFSVPDPEKPDVPIPAELSFPWSLAQKLPFFPELLAAVQVNERPLRFKTSTQQASCQLLASNTVGLPNASVHIRWTPIPWDYPANPNTTPPQTILNPLVSQRFEMLNGEFRFDDAASSGVHGFGSGRTFPNFPRGLSLDIGAVIDVLEGFGKLAGHQGLMVVNGVITPPNELALNIMQRIIDPSGDLLARSPLPPLQPQPFPDPQATFMIFLGEPDPERMSTLRRGAQGEILGLELYERLRLIDLDFAVSAAGPLSQVAIGKVVGRASSTLSLPLGQTSIPIPVQTRKTEFQFFDTGLRFGSVRADLVEGRGFPTVIAGAPTPIYRVGGFGPIQGGTCEFEGAQGLLSMNALLSIYPRTFSNLYIFRFIDPDHKLQPIAGSALA